MSDAPDSYLCVNCMQPVEPTLWRRPCPHCGAQYIAWPPLVRPFLIDRGETRQAPQEAVDG